MRHATLTLSSRSSICLRPHEPAIAAVAFAIFAAKLWLYASAPIYSAALHAGAILPSPPVMPSAPLRPRSRRKTRLQAILRLADSAFQELARLMHVADAGAFLRCIKILPDLTPTLRSNGCSCRFFRKCAHSAMSGGICSTNYMKCSMRHFPPCVCWLKRARYFM